MTAIVRLALQHAAFRWGRTCIVIACVAVAVALPIASRLVANSFETSLTARASQAPIVVGAEGSRFDLLFSSLYFRLGGVSPVRQGVYDDLLATSGVLPIPIHAEFSARDAPIVGTSIEYFERRGFTLSEGRLPVRLGEAVVGSAAADRLGLRPGDAIRNEPRRLYDITTTTAVELNIVGVLAATESPDDAAIFIDIDTAWVLEGLSHGHDDAQSIDDPEQVLGRDDDFVALSGAVVPYQRIDDSNAASFHTHGDPADLPLTAILIYPETAKDATIVRTRLNSDPLLLAIEPVKVVEELIGFLVRIRTLIDAVAVLLAGAVLVLIGLVAFLTARTRHDELRMLGEIGVARTSVAGLLAADFTAVMLIGAIVGVGCGFAVWQLAVAALGVSG
ncbi:MAG: ABC transporter permease [Planctomycetota bacterium]